MRAKQEIKLTSGVNAGEVETRHKYASSLKEIFRNIDSFFFNLLSLQRKT